MQALLLIAHGSRRAEANADLVHVAEAMQSRGHYAHVQVSYLELAPPTIAEGGALCVDEGATDVIMMPYFLSAGVHVQDDMTKVQAELSERFPDVTFKLAAPLGRHPLLLEIVEQRAAEAIHEPEA